MGNTELCKWILLLFFKGSITSTVPFLPPPLTHFSVPHTFYSALLCWSEESRKSGKVWWKGHHLTSDYSSQCPPHRSFFNLPASWYYQQASPTQLFSIPFIFILLQDQGMGERAGATPQGHAMVPIWIRSLLHLTQEQGLTAAVWLQVHMANLCKMYCIVCPPEKGFLLYWSGCMWGSFSVFIFLFFKYFISCNCIVERNTLKWARTPFQAFHQWELSKGLRHNWARLFTKFQCCNPTGFNTIGMVWGEKKLG